MICVLTGAVHSGKTRAATAAVEFARAAGRRVMGVLCPGRMRRGVRTSIDVEDIATGTRVRLASLSGSERERIGRFSFRSRGLAHGRRALRRAIRRLPDVVVIDEIGPLELAGRGWRAPVDQLVSAYRDRRSRLLVLVVREGLLERVRREWRLNPIVVRADDPRAVDRILAVLHIRSTT
jgi:nucleoside-triphosphatase THEP1